MKTQRGFTLIEIGIFLLILGAVGGAATAIVHTYNHALDRAQAAESDAKVKGLALTDQLVNNATLRARQEEYDKQLAARASEDQRIAALERKFNAKLADLYAQSPEARKWAATPIPDDVRRLLRARAAGGDGNGQDGKGAAAAPVVKPDAATAVPRPGPAHGRPLGVRPATGIQPK